MTNDAMDGTLEEDDNLDEETEDSPESEPEAEEEEPEGEDEGEESEEEAEEEPAPKPAAAPDKAEEEKREKKKNAFQNRINKLNRERYQAIALAKKREEENTELKRMLDLSSQTAQYHFDNSIQMNLEKARKIKEEAKISGDINAEVDADIILSKAIQDYNSAEQWKQQQNLYNQYTPQKPIEAQDIVDYIPTKNLNNFDSWKSKNEWFEAPTDEHEEGLSQEIDNYAVQLNNYLVNQGRPDKILSPEYFIELDAKVAQLKEVYGKPDTKRPAYQTPQRRNPAPMKPNTRPVTPVGNSRGTVAAPQASHVTLSSEQKQMARAINMSEKDYAKYVMKFQRNQQLMRDQGE